jgi:molybdopterin-guanine dinucleotide biosynthesis protein A
MDAIILAGGQGRRLGGVEKAFLRLGDRTFIEYLLETISPLAKTVIVTTNAPDLYAHLHGVRVVADEQPGKGPLMGLYSGLLASDAEWSFVTTVDAPLLQPALVRYLADAALEWDAVVPTWERGPEPLCALYARRCLPAIKRALPMGRIISFYPSVRIRLVPERSVRGVDPAGLSFFNVNAAEDYEKLLRMHEPPAR